MATHSSLLAWKLLGMEEPDGLWSMALQRVGHDWQEHRQTSRKPNHHGTHSQTSIINTRAAWGAPACRAACGPGIPLTVCGKHLEEAGREGRSVLAPEP